MGTTLCVTVTGRSMAELIARRDEVTDADLVELRLDSVPDPSAAGAVTGRRRPVIVTCRPTWEGGGFAGAEEERQRLLADAQRLGAEYIDVEWRAGFAAELIAARRGGGVVLSQHDFQGVPEDLAARADAMRRTGAAVVKLAVMAHRLSDCLPLLSLARAATTPTVAIAMGEAGLATRVLATRFASCWTYAGDGAAPGQISAARMLHEFRVRDLDAATQLYGVVGRPIAHSLSPAMHNAAFAAAGLNAVYLPLPAHDYDDFVRFAEGMDLAGASVTAPFKRDACAHASTHDALSLQAGSVNTLRRTNRRWEACNTDVAGMLAPLRARGLALTGVRATVLGAGGAARAAAVALVAEGAIVSISARRPEQAEGVATNLGLTRSAYPPPPGSWDVLINATPVGTRPEVDDSPVPAEQLRGGRLVYDLVYNPADTRLLRDARAAGCRTIGGLEMLVAQAARQFTWWTGVEPSIDTMQSAAQHVLATAFPDRLSPSGTLS